jgi:hypothetical protein
MSFFAAGDYDREMRDAVIQPNLLYDRQGIPICQQNDAADFDNLNLIALHNQIALPRERLVTQSGQTLSSYTVGQLFAVCLPVAVSLLEASRRCMVPVPRGVFSGLHAAAAAGLSVDRASSV